MMPSEPVANITLTNCSWWIPDDSWWFDMKSRSVSRSVSRRVFLSSFLIHSSVMTVSLSHRIHVWNICQHWGYIDGKCYHIYHTWILWVWKMGWKMAPAGDFPSWTQAGSLVQDLPLKPLDRALQGTRGALVQAVLLGMSVANSKNNSVIDDRFW